jgi:uracil-DNA glycosylase
VDSLPLVAEQVRSCPRCRLAETRTHAVPGEGPADARLLLVGEAPGATEDRVGRPFQGAAGRHLDGVLTDLGLDRSHVFVTSVCKCRPPRNRDPRPDEVAACAPYLDRQLALLAPSVVLAMGLVAGRRLGAAPPGGRLADARGVRGPEAGRPWHLLVTYHPAAAMRFPRLREPFAEDLAEAVRLAAAAG